MAEKNINETHALKTWEILYMRYVAGIIVKILLLSISVILFISSALNILFKEFNGIILIISGLIIFIAWFFCFFKQFNRTSFNDFLNHKYSFLEFSSQLIPFHQKDFLPQLQRERVSQILVEKQREIKVWGNLKPSIVIAICITSLYFVVKIIPVNNHFIIKENKQNISILPTLPDDLSGKLPEIISLRVTVAAPPYTGLSSQNSSELSLNSPAGSKIYWEFTLQNHINIFQIIWNGKDTVNINAKESKYNWQTTLQNSLIYQVRYGENGKWFVSPIYTAQAIEDKPPLISVKNPLPYTFVIYGKKPEVEVLLNLSDDYGLNNAHLVATVSRGSGESVKFREMEVKFGENISGRKTAALKKNLNFNELKMEPGDELYFYAEATDQSDKHNKSRSDMYFIQWEDTTSEKMSITAGISLDNVPAYFRSQRQIIIDTEKLLSEKNKLTDEEFQRRSNDLGVDQKILRLRYGQFLGEEFEGNIGGHKHSEENEDDHKEGHPTGKENSDHVKEHADQKAIENLHHHEENRKDNQPTFFGQKVDMSEYEHIHDVADVATFFDETLKVQLKAALAQMWDSELRLRTMRPKEALPYEYKALELIKSLQQKSRVYVEKVGFKPTPLKPFEKRLTGELTEIQNPFNSWDEKTIEKAYPALRKAVSILENAINENYILSMGDKQILEKAGIELSELILKQPGINVSLLNNLREIINGNKSISKKSVQKQLIRLLPSENKEPGKMSNGYEPELESFINKMSK